jgi:hypothetical protein
MKVVNGLGTHSVYSTTTFKCITSLDLDNQFLKSFNFWTFVLCDDVGHLASHNFGSLLFCGFIEIFGQFLANQLSTVFHMSEYF